MGVLSRRKKEEVKGFKDFVRLLETTPAVRQRDILLAAVLDDPIYTEWGTKNLLTPNSFFELSRDEFFILIEEIPNYENILGRAFHSLNELERDLLTQNMDEKHFKKYKEECKYLPALSAGEIEVCVFKVYEHIRNLQDSGDINSIEWNLPEPDVLREKKVDVNSGRWNIYHKNGAVAASGELINYERHGNWSHYYSSGEAMAVGPYKRDKKDGPWVFFYRNGKKMGSGDYQNDEKTGEWVSYDSDGVATKVNY